MVKKIEQAPEEIGPDINGFTLVNPEKAHRAIHGAIVDKGQVVGGVGEGAAPEAILAEYDRIGGLVKKGKYKVKMGSFYDFKGRKPRDKAQIEYVFRDLEGDEVAIPENEPIPMEILAADKAAQNRTEKALKDAAKKKTPAKKNKPDDADEE